MKIRKIFFMILLLCILWLSKPFTILLLGSDARPSQNLKGSRTDSIVLIKVTPLLGKIKMVSIPRDTYTQIPCENGKLDKINHSFAFGGTKCTVKAVEKLLKTKVNYSILFRFEDVIEMTSLIGGVDIVANHSFTQDGESFKKGKAYNVQGPRALAYVRHRKTDSAFKRDERQRQVLLALVKKMSSPVNVVNIPKFISHAEKHMEIKYNYFRTPAILPALIINGTDIESYELVGNGTKIRGVYYLKVNDESLRKVRKAFKVYF